MTNHTNRFKQLEPARVINHPDACCRSIMELHPGRGRLSREPEEDEVLVMRSE